MRYLGLKAIHRIKFRQTTDSAHNKPVAANLLNQNFVMTRLDEAWVGDITYIRVGQKWLYLAVIIDLYSRKVVGWSMGKRMKADLVCDALKMVLHNCNYPKGVIRPNVQPSGISRLITIESGGTLALTIRVR